MFNNFNSFSRPTQPSGFLSQPNPAFPRPGTFPNYNQPINQSDTEFKSVLNTYRTLYNSNDSQCLFRVPVFNPLNSSMPKVQFNAQVTNPQELEYLLNYAQQNLNPDPMNLTSCLLIGLENIQKRVQIDRETCDGIIKQLDEGVLGPSRKIRADLEENTREKVRKIQDNNYSILQRVIRIEKKLHCIARKLRRADVNLENKIKVVDVLKLLSKNVLLINENVKKIRDMIEGRSASPAGNRRTPREEGRDPAQAQEEAPAGARCPGGQGGLPGSGLEGEGQDGPA